MSLKLKAALVTFGLLCAAIAFSAIGAFILANVSAAVIADAFICAFFGWCVYLLYGITLNRLEYQETLKNLNKKD